MPDEEQIMRYRFIDHTADVAFEVYGSNLKELIENATLAFYDAFVFLDRLEVSKSKEVEVEADSPDYLLFDWLNELLFLFETEFFAGKEVEVDIKEGKNLKAKGKLKGGRIVPELVKTEPKAITFHKFRVERRDNGWYAFVIVDI